jgi:hypothetical protein
MVMNFILPSARGATGNGRLTNGINSALRSFCPVTRRCCEAAGLFSLDYPMKYAELWGAMKRLNLLSDAWQDFVAALDQQLDGAFMSDVGHVEAPADFSDYWSAVAAGKGSNYDARGFAK